MQSNFLGHSNRGQCECEQIPPSTDQGDVYTVVTGAVGCQLSMEAVDMHQWKRWTCINGSVGHASMDVVDTHQWKR